MVSIRPYEPADATRVAQLSADFQDFLVPLDPDGRLRRTPEYGQVSLERKLKRMDTGSAALYVAVDGEVVVGYAFAAIDPIPPPEALHGMHPVAQGTGEELYVMPSYRGKGVGKALVERVEQFFREHGCVYENFSVLAFNKEAVAFYEKLGLAVRGLWLSKKL